MKGFVGSSNIKILRYIWEEEKKVNRITEITKRDILNLFKNGLEIDDFFETRTVPYPYFGGFEELDFLKRLYGLRDMTNNDTRYGNTEHDIWQHTFNNYDYPNCWILKMKDFERKISQTKILLTHF